MVDRATVEKNYNELRQRLQNVADGFDAIYKDIQKDILTWSKLDLTSGNIPESKGALTRFEKIQTSDEGASCSASAEMVTSGRELELYKLHRSLEQYETTRCSGVPSDYTQRKDDEASGLGSILYTDNDLDGIEAELQNPDLTEKQLNAMNINLKGIKSILFTAEKALRHLRQK